MYVKAPIPSEVYHLTKKANLESILDDGAIRRFDDTECWFCESLAKMKAYMEQTVLCEGKPYYGAGGQLCRYPKFEPDEHIILKLTPCRREGNWYRWNQEIPLNSPPELVQAAAKFSKLKIGFRGDLPFQNAEAIDVAEFLHGSIVCRNVQTTSELWKRLSEKVEQNWQTYQRNLYDRSPGVLIGIADEIAATATCYSEFLCSGSDLSRRDLSYLLQFENPLDVLRDRWVLDQSTEQGTRFLGMLESLRSEGHAEQDYPLDEAYAQTQKNEMTMQLYLVQTPLEKRKLQKRTVTATLLILLLIPLTLFVGVYYFAGRKYYFISLLILLECMLPFFLIFEGRKPQARELVLIAVLVALNVAGRAAFFMLPEFKPVVAMTILAGVAFGGETGFLVGAMTMLVSNMLFSQGPWTPWQMFAMGIIGWLAGVLYRKGVLRRGRLSLCIFGVICSTIVYGGIMNPASALMWSNTINWKIILSYYVTGVPVDLVRAIATFFFLWLGAEPMLEKLDRVKTKYGLAE